MSNFCIFGLRVVQILAKVHLRYELGDGGLGGEFLVQSPERSFTAGVRHGCEVAVHEGKLGVGDKHVKGAGNDAFIEVDVVDSHDCLEAVRDILAGKTVKIAH